MVAQTSSTPVQCTVLMSPEEAQKKARIRELNERIGIVQEQHLTVIGRNEPKLDQLNHDILLLIPFMESNEQSPINQKIKSLKAEVATLRRETSAIWSTLADLYDEEAALTGNPSRSGRTREEIKSRES